jgi:hypothetical protein
LASLGQLPHTGADIPVNFTQAEAGNYGVPLRRDRRPFKNGTCDLN